MALRTLSMPASRRELAERPRHAAALALVGTAGAASIFWAAFYAPNALRVMTLAATAPAIALGWRARASFGCKRRLPPGSLGLRNSLQAIVDRGFYDRQFSRHGPIFKMAQFHQPVICVADISVGREILRRESEKLVLTPLPIDAEIPRGFVRYMEPADYAVYSKLFREAFSRSVLERNRDFALRAVRDGVAARAEDIDTSGGVNPRSVVESFLLSTLRQIFFGDFIEARDHRLVEECCHGIASTNATGRASSSTRRALRAFDRLIRERSSSDRPSRHDDTSIWGRALNLRPETRTDPTAIANLLVLLDASRDSIGGLLTWVLKNLAEHPPALERLRLESDPATTRLNGGRVDHIVLETLRLAQSEYVYRRVTRPFDLNGFRVPSGWFIRICVAEAHRRDPPFDRPTIFDPTRFETRRFSPDEFSPFGLDHHACLGAQLTMFMGRLLIEVVARDFELRLVADAPPERENRHWSHWRPGAGVRIAFSAR